MVLIEEAIGGIQGVIDRDQVAGVIVFVADKDVRPFEVGMHERQALNATATALDFDAPSSTFLNVVKFAVLAQKTPVVSAAIRYLFNQDFLGRAERPAELVAEPLL